MLTNLSSPWLFPEKTLWQRFLDSFLLFEPWHEISNNVVWATSKASDQSAHTFLPNILIIFQYSFQIQWWIGKLTLNMWKNFRADSIYLHFNLHQWLVYKTSAISTSHVAIQGTCWKWKYLSRFYCEEIMNIDFDEEMRKLPTKSFLKYSRELSTYP